MVQPQRVGSAGIFRIQKFGILIEGDVVRADAVVVGHGAAGIYGKGGVSNVAGIANWAPRNRDGSRVVGKSGQSGQQYQRGNA